MILPIVEYADIIIDSASAFIRKKYQTLQNKALRCARDRERTASSKEIHSEAKLLKLKYRRKQHILHHMFQVSRMKNFQLWKARSTQGVRTRSSKKKLMTTIKPNNEKYKKSISYRGPKLWNSLPAELQKLDSYYEFKASLLKLLSPTPAPDLALALQRPTPQ